MSTSAALKPDITVIFLYMFWRFLRMDLSIYRSLNVLILKIRLKIDFLSFFSCIWQYFLIYKEKNLNVILQN